jgi:pimeloyl-ACP methyl ester carboxylesterase
MYRHVNYNGRQLYYQCTGNGPAVVFVHGFGEDSKVWAFQKEVLQQHFQILIPDLPGSGQSQAIEDMSMEGLADAVYFILQQEGITQCVVIGHSMGGYITLAFAEKYASLLKGFGLFHSSAFADDDEKIATRKKGIAFIREHGAFNFLKTATPNLYSPATKQVTPALIEEQVQAARHFSADALVAYYEAMIQRPDRTAVLKNAQVPVLFIFGKWDTAVPFKTGLAQCYLPQLAYIHVLDHSGHMGMTEEPETSAGILNYYVSETFGSL